MAGALLVATGVVGGVVGSRHQPEVPEAEAPTPDRAFGRAAQALREAGSFSYEGTARSPRATMDWPVATGGDEVRVDGAASLPGRSVERATSSTVVTDTIVSGMGVWQRSAAAASIDATGWAVVATPPVGAAGLVNLPRWLTETVDRSLLVPAAVTALLGDVGRTFAGTAAMAGHAIDGATVVLTLDARGLPRHVAIRPTPDSRAPELDVEISDVGRTVNVAPPGGDEIGRTPEQTSADLAAAGIVAPAQLGSLPPGWTLIGSEVILLEMDGSCHAHELDYGPADGSDDFIVLTTSNEDCPSHEPVRGGLPIGGSWRAMPRTIPGGSEVEATDGTARAEAFSTLPTPELVDVMRSLEPYRQLDQPVVLDTGVPELP